MSNLLSGKGSLGVTSSSIDLEKGMAQVSGDKPRAVSCASYGTSCCQRRKSRVKVLRLLSWLVGYANREERELVRVPGSW